MKLRSYQSDIIKHFRKYIRMRKVLILFDI